MAPCVLPDHMTTRMRLIAVAQESATWPTNPDDIASMVMVYSNQRIYHKKSTIHVGKYTMTMDGMGYDIALYWLVI